MPILTILALAQALIPLVPEAASAASIIEKMIAGQTPTPEDITALEQLTTALNNLAAKAEANAGATGPTE